MAEALRKLADPPYAELIGMRAQRWIARFTWEEMAKQVMDILRAEEGRLSHLPDDRRSHTDLSTVAVVPFALLPESQTLHFRPTDRSLVGAEGLVVLLRGTDTDRPVPRCAGPGCPSRRPTIRACTPWWPDPATWSRWRRCERLTPAAPTGPGVGSGPAGG